MELESWLNMDLEQNISCGGTRKWLKMEQKIGDELYVITFIMILSDLNSVFETSKAHSVEYLQTIFFKFFLN